jgi:hypothetical protein
MPSERPATGAQLTPTGPDVGDVRRRLRPFTVPAILLVSLLLGGRTMLDSWVRQMLYPAPPVPVSPAPPAGLDEVILTTDRGDRVVAWWHAEPPAGDPVHAGDAATGPRPVVLYLHGNGENLATVHRSGMFGQLARMGATTMAVDYPGYGRSTGTPGQAANVAAARAAVEWLQATWPGRPRVVFGWSLGSAVAAQLVAARPGDVRVAVLASAWHDLPRVASRHVPAFLVGVALRDRYDSAAALASVGDRLPPLYLIHGADDSLIPVDDGEALHRAARDATAAAGHRVAVRWVPVPRAGHNDLFHHDLAWQVVGEAVDAAR